MNIDHIQDRIARRAIPSTPEELITIAKQYTVSTAVILGKRLSDESGRKEYVKVILIVRNSKPVTIMTRRESQKFDKRNFDVQQIVYLQ
jgi:hypothetical protein